MRALHLFAGAGGSLLAGRLMGWESVGAVEWDPFCRRVLRARGERVIALGNGWVPHQAVYAFNILWAMYERG